MERISTCSLEVKLYGIYKENTDKCQEVVILITIYGTFITCFASYSGKSLEIIELNHFMLYLSYST